MKAGVWRSLIAALCWLPAMAGLVIAVPGPWSTVMMYSPHGRPRPAAYHVQVQWLIILSGIVIGSLAITVVLRLLVDRAW